MKNKIIIAGKELTEATVKKLDDILMKSNIEQLKKQMEKLFTFKNICTMHDDHITELAECIVDLWMAEDKAEWARHTEDYSKARIARYHKRKQQYFQKVQWAKVTKKASEEEMLDMTYRLWVYEHGFEHSHFQMYTMLYRITQTILQNERSRK